MTSAPVVNGMDFMVTPRTDNMQTHKADEQFAGSLRKAVEKGKPEAAEKTGKRENVKTAKERMKSSGETKTVSSGRNDRAAENR